MSHPSDALVHIVSSLRGVEALCTSENVSMLCTKCLCQVQHSCYTMYSCCCTTDCVLCASQTDEMEEVSQKLQEAFSMYRK